MKKHRGAITARMLANLLIMAGADHVVSMDLHASQMQGFFTKPVDNLYGGPSLARWIKNNVPDYKDAIVVSKNPGGTKRLTALADSLKINFAMIHTDRRRAKDLYAQNKDLQQLKKRKWSLLRKSKPIVTEGEGGEEENLIFSNGIQTARVRNGHVIADEEADSAIVDTDDENKKEGFPGESLGGTVDAFDSEDEEENPGHEVEKLITLVGSVKDRAAIILDDMIDRPSSFVSAAEHLVATCQAKRVYVVATHGIFTGDCLEQLENCPYIHQIVVTNTYPISKEHIENSKKLVVIDVSAIFAECIRRDHYGESISVLFDSVTTL